MIRYAREDFQPVYLVPGQHYCPGCNASPDDYAIPSVNCPCASHGSGKGSLTSEQVEEYLRD